MFQKTPKELDKKESFLNKFQTITGLLNSYNINYYLDMHTLAEYHQNNTLFSTKHKAYLSLYAKDDFQKIHTVIAAIRKKGFKVLISTFLNKKTKEDKEFFTNPYNIQSIQIDKSIYIFFKYEYNSSLIWKLNSVQYQIPRSLINGNFVQINIDNMLLNIPKNSQAYMDAIYGDWELYDILQPVKSLVPCTLRNKFDKIIKVGQHEGKRFKYHCNKHQGLILLKKTIRILEKHKVAYYLDFGTLIGAIREKGFIEWDDDVDISLLHEEEHYKMQAVLRDIQKSGLSAYRATFATSISNRQEAAKNDPSIELFVNNIDFTDIHNTRILKVTHKNRFEKFLIKILNKFGQKRKGGKSLDIFFKYKKDNQLIWMAQNKVHHIDINELSTELIDVYFYNLKCKIPKNYAQYLTSMYGDWETPKVDWQYYEEDTVTRG